MSTKNPSAAIMLPSSSNVNLGENTGYLMNVDLWRNSNLPPKIVMLPTSALLNLFEDSPDHGTVEVGPPAPHVGFKDDQTARLRPFPYLLFNEWSTSVDGKAIGRIDISFIDIFSPLPYLVTLEQSHFAILLKLIEVQSRVQSKV